MDGFSSAAGEGSWNWVKTVTAGWPRPFSGIAAKLADSSPRLFGTNGRVDEEDHIGWTMMPWYRLLYPLLFTKLALREGEGERLPGLRFPGAEPVLGPQQIFCPTRVGWLCTLQILPLFKPRSAITAPAMVLIPDTTAEIEKKLSCNEGRCDEELSSGENEEMGKSEDVRKKCLENCSVTRKESSSLCPQPIAIWYLSCKLTIRSFLPRARAQQSISVSTTRVFLETIARRPTRVPKHRVRESELIPSLGFPPPSPVRNRARLALRA